MDILRVVAQSYEGLRLSDLAREMGLAQPTVHNLANTLVRGGFLAKVADPVRYRIGPAMQDLAAKSGDVDLPDSTLIETFNSTTADSLLVVEWSGSDFVIQRRIDRSRANVVQRVGTVVPSPYQFVTSLCLLAFLPAMDLDSFLKKYPIEEYGGQIFSKREQLIKFLTSSSKLGVAVQQNAKLFRAAVPFFHASGTLRGAIGVYCSKPMSVNPAKIIQALKSTANL